MCLTTLASQFKSFQEKVPEILLITLLGKDPIYLWVGGPVVNFLVVFATCFGNPLLCKFWWKAQPALGSAPVMPDCPFPAGPGAWAPGSVHARAGDQEQEGNTRQDSDTRVLGSCMGGSAVLMGQAVRTGGPPLLALPPTWRLALVASRDNSSH